jgi:hypothetical protein
MEHTKTQLTKVGLHQARKHPRTTARIGAYIGRHPRRTWKVVSLARHAQDIAAATRGAALAYRREQARARRRAKIRGVAIGMSVIGAGAVAGLKIAQSHRA